MTEFYNGFISAYDMLISCPVSTIHRNIYLYIISIDWILEKIPKKPSFSP